MFKNLINLLSKNSNGIFNPIKNYHSRKTQFFKLSMNLCNLFFISTEFMLFIDRNMSYLEIGIRSEEY